MGIEVRAVSGRDGGIGGVEVFAVAGEGESGVDDFPAQIGGGEGIGGGRRGGEIRGQVVIEHALIRAGEELEIVWLAGMLNGEDTPEADAAGGQGIDVGSVRRITDDLSEGAVFLHDDDDVIIAVRCGAGSPCEDEGGENGESGGVHDCMALPGAHDAMVTPA